LIQTNKVTNYKETDVQQQKKLPKGQNKSRSKRISRFNNHEINTIENLSQTTLRQCGQSDKYLARLKRC